jgi:DeoR/GlpR family transcriptional regulator of sugar metabolism
LSRDPSPKKERQTKLVELLNEDPFLTDEDLAEILKVSINRGA